MGKNLLRLTDFPCFPEEKDFNSPPHQLKEMECQINDYVVTSQYECYTNPCVHLFISAPSSL